MDKDNRKTDYIQQDRQKKAPVLGYFSIQAVKRRLTTISTVTKTVRKAPVYLASAWMWIIISTTT